MTFCASGSRTTTNSHGCLFSALGAWVPARRIISTVASSTGVSAYSRYARCAKTTSKNGGPPSAVAT